MNDQQIKFVFFGSSDISVTSLEHLKEKGLLPVLVVTKPDSPQGRGLELAATPVKVWAEANKIEYITPDLVRNAKVIEEIKETKAEIGVLVSYGKLIPDSLIDAFPKGIINLHPSMLPKLRGPAPIEYSILNDMKDEVGVSIMLLDAELDHGPILAQKSVSVKSWPASKSELYKQLSDEGAELLSKTLPKYMSGEIMPVPQDHSAATYSSPIEKKDGEISLTDDPYKNFIKFKAYEGWPGIFFFEEKDGAEPDGRPSKKIRVKITEAIYENGEFKILKVIPEGKKEMDYTSFQNGLGNFRD